MLLRHIISNVVKKWGSEKTVQVLMIGVFGAAISSTVGSIVLPNNPEEIDILEEKENELC